tara:strand:- start:4082 stop:4258 length:177 start_codon:yes stop_codon:yes gene_type:complete
MNDTDKKVCKWYESQINQAKQELEDAEENVVQKKNHLFLLIAEIEEWLKQVKQNEIKN